MKVTRLEAAASYRPPKHDDCHAMHLQHERLGSQAPYWVGCSYYLPGGTADWDASPVHKVYVVLDGQITVSVDGEETTLGRLDSVYLAPGENRRVRNDTNRLATMLVVMPYPEGEGPAAGASTATTAATATGIVHADRSNPVEADESNKLQGDPLGDEAGLGRGTDT